jgi:hypothetical protein
MSERRPKHHFQFDRDFTLDQHTGIYKPKSNNGENECPHCDQPIRRHPPLSVEIKRDMPAYILAFLAIIISAATLLVVATYTYYAGGQWHEMIRAANATKQAADAATDSATTAKSALDASQQQFRTEQRPYIWATPETAPPNGGTALVPLQNGRYRVGWIVTLFNGGHSPAKVDFGTHAVTHVTEMDRFAKEVASFVPRYEGPGEIAPPQVKFVASGDFIDITHDQYLEFMDRKLAIYIIGAIKYRDIFEPSITPYETRYCFSLNPVGFPYSPCPAPDGNSVK